MKLKKLLACLLSIVLTLGIVPLADLALKVEANTTGFQWPMSGYWVTQPFGDYSTTMANNYGRPYHSGIDMKSNNTNIYPTADGTVVYKGFSNGNGNHVIIEHKFNNSTIKSLYSHLANFANCPSVGQSVTKDTIIGIMGNTGNSTGPHLHFGFFTGSSTDPVGYTSTKGENYVTHGSCTYYNPSYIINNDTQPQPTPVNHTRDTNYGTEFTATANCKMSVTDANDIVQSNRYISAGDVCTIHEVYVDGCCKVTYPSSASSTGYATYYAKIANFTIHSTDTEKPVVSNVAYEINSTGYVVTCSLSDNVGVTRVAFPSWTDANGQDDLLWIDGNINPDGKSAWCQINRSDHNNEFGGYTTHVYAYDAAGNSTSADICVNLENDTQAPIFSEVKVAIMQENGYTLTAKVSDNIDVTKVMFPTWIEGQSGGDAIWLAGTYDPTYDHWACWVPVSNWNNHYGTYYTHVYAYDALGNETGYDPGPIRVPKLDGNNEELAAAKTYDLSKTSTLYAAGWVYNKNGDEVKLRYRIDSGTWYAIELVERQDVVNARPECKQLKCGYYANIPISDLAAGAHKIDIIAETDGMSSVIYSADFTVVRPEAYVYFDMNDGSSNNINLFAPQKATRTVNGITYSFDGTTGIMTLNGSSSTDVDLFSKPFYVKNGEVYKVTADYVSGTLSNGMLVFEARDNDGNRANCDISNSDKTVTWSISSTQAAKINRVNLWAWKSTSATGNLTFSNYKVKIKLEKVASSSAAATAYTPNAKYLAYGQTYATMPVPTRTGYTFNGWYTAKTGGTKIEASTVYKQTTAQTLYAQWKANTSTKYVVNHYQMNVSGSGYTLKETENKTGTTASSLMIANLKKTYTGFTYEGGKGTTSATATKPSTLDTSTTVLADGTRVINIYYARNKYALTLNKGTGISAVSGAGTYYYGQSITIDATVSTGYTWLKWSDNNTTKKATITMPANALTLTANATLNSYTISYTLNGGTVATANPTSYNVTTADFTLNNPTRTGYTFAGWTGTGLSAATKTVTVAKGSTDNRSYTATWTANTYTVTFNANGGTTSTASKTVTYDSTYGTLPTPTRTGYTFNGWYTATSGGAKVTADTKVTTASNHTLYAQWTANGYTIAFNGNGATSGSMSNLAMTYGTAKNLTANAFVKTGYSFNGWNTRADGSGTPYADKASVNNLTSTKGATVTLYAQWKINTYTISYTLNGGTVSTANPTSYNVTTAAFTLNNPTRTGYTFAGWTGTGLSAATKTVTVAKGSTGNRSYTATWTANTYTVTFDANGGTCDTTSKSVAFGSKYGTLPIPTLENHAFIGWYTSTGSFGEKVTEDSIVDLTSNVKLYARWEVSSFTIKYYNYQNYHNMPNDQNVPCNIPFNLSSQIPLRSGYVFSHWEDYNGNTFYPGQECIFDEDTFLFEGYVYMFARWNAASYVLTFDANGGTTSTKSKSVTYGATYGTLPTPTRTGYTFNGWCFDRLGLNKVNADTKVEITSDKTLYALWSANTYTIAFNGNGATSGSMSNLAMTYGTAKNLTANSFAKTGYTFNGWNTKADGSGTAYADKASVNNLTSTKGATVTLYAQWKCSHSYTSAVTKAATCTADGVRTYTCHTCGHSYTEAIAKIGHSYKSVVTAPTCTTDGYTTHSCANCKDSYTDSTVKATGHKWNDATCTVAKTCSVCGTTSGSALGHSYTSAVTKAATCTADGVRTYTCQTCGHSYTEAIAKIGHNYKSVVTAPTCTKDGYTTHTCENCNDSYTDSAVKATGHKWNDATCTVAKTCSVCGTTSGSALGHSYTSAVTKAATCTADGVRTYTCQTCGHSYTEAIAKIGHNYKSVVTAPTCTKDGYTTHTCANCNDSYTDSTVKATGHKWNDATCTVAKTCSVCGTTSGSALGHSYTSAVTKAATCTADGVRTYTCQTCGHSYTEAIAKIGHNYKSVVTAPTCTKDGYTTHTCENCNDSYIDSKTVMTGHSFDDWFVVREPSCTASGIDRRKCNGCGEIENRVVKAYGHLYEDDYTIDVEATFTSAGSKSIHCALCDSRINVTEIPKAAQNCIVDNGFVYGFASGLTKEDLLKDHFNNNAGTITISNTVAGTGTVVTKTNEIGIKENLSVVVFGDVNGDSWYDGQDAVLVSCLANAMLTKDDVSEAVWMAADCNHDGVIDQLDVDLLNQAGTLLANVDQSKPAEVLLETSSEYVEYLDLIDQSPEIEVEDDTETDVEPNDPESEDTEVEEVPTDDTEDTAQRGSVVSGLIDMIVNLINSIFEMLLSYISVPIK